METRRRWRAITFSLRSPHELGSRLGKPWQFALCAAAPLMVLGWDLHAATSVGGVAVDLQHAYLGAAREVAHGRTPYPAPQTAPLGTGAVYVYPPLTAFLTTPLLLVPQGVAVWVGIAAMLACFAGALWILDVRDYRCYGIALLWLPTLAAVQSANLSLPLLLAVAVGWRYRSRARGAVAIGAGIAGKLILWPMIVWLVAARRYRPAMLAVTSAGALIIGPWALLSFQGVGTYWRLARDLEKIMGPRSYTAAALLQRLGVAHATALGMMVGAAVLALAAISALHGAEPRSFALAVLASLLLSPIVWLHYFVLLAAPIAIYRPRFSPAWLLPLVLWACPVASHDGLGTSGSAWQIILALTVAIVLASSLRETHRGRLQVEAA